IRRWYPRAMVALLLLSVLSRPLYSRLPPPLHGPRRIAGGGGGVFLAIRARLVTFFDQPLGGRVDAKAPSDRRHAPHEIRPAAIRALALAVGRRTVQRMGVA